LEVVKKKPRATRRTRRDAVVVKASGKLYSEVLAMVTPMGDKQWSDLRSCGLDVGKDSAESAEAMKESIARLLGDAASVRVMSDETNLFVLEIRNIDSIATKKAVLHRGVVRIGLDLQNPEKSSPPKMLQMVGTRAYCSEMKEASGLERFLHKMW